MVHLRQDIAMECIKSTESITLDEAQSFEKNETYKLKQFVCHKCK